MSSLAQRASPVTVVGMINFLFQEISGFHKLIHGMKLQAASE